MDLVNEMIREVLDPIVKPVKDSMCRILSSLADVKDFRTQLEGTVVEMNTTENMKLIKNVKDLVTTNTLTETTKRMVVMHN